MQISTLHYRYYPNEKHGLGNKNSKTHSTDLQEKNQYKLFLKGQAKCLLLCKSSAIFSKIQYVSLFLSPNLLWLIY